MTPSEDHRLIQLTAGQPITHIYGLVDPTTNVIRYVGKSDCPKKRLWTHLGPVEMKADTRKSRWLKRLAANNLIPALIVIETVPRENWQIAERKWIAYYRSQENGHLLTNTTAGGDGVDKGTKHRPESVQKIIAALIGRPFSEESRRKSSLKQKGRKPPPSQIENQAKAARKVWANLSDDVKKAKIAALNHGWSAESRNKTGYSHRAIPKRNGATSPYRGVSWFKRGNCWRSYFFMFKKQIHLGYFPIDKIANAARAYDLKAVEFFGELAQTNFPLSDYAIFF